MSAPSEREALQRLIYTFPTIDLGENLAITTRDSYNLADAILAHFRQSRADGGDCERCEALWPASPEQIAGGWSRGWTDAMRFAHHAHTDENGRTSADGVLGAGPDCIIVDEDWLDAQLSSRAEIQAEALEAAARDADESNCGDDEILIVGDPEDDETWVAITIGRWLRNRAQRIREGGDRG